MTLMKAVALSAVFLAASVSSATAEVQISLENGRVTLTATNATVREILAEWARVGGTTVVNAERIPGGPLTLQLTGMPEHEALDLLLRSVTGYVAAPRPQPAANLSRYDRILVLATPAMARTPVTASSAPAPVFQQPAFDPQSGLDDSDPSVVQAPRGPLFPTAPRVVIDDQGDVPPPEPIVVPGVQRPQVPGDAFAAPTGTFAAPATTQPFFGAAPGGAVVGTPRPGMVIPTPAAQPGAIEVQQPPSDTDN
jgi:hypothetical protein